MVLQRGWPYLQYTITIIRLDFDGNKLIYLDTIAINRRYRYPKRKHV